MKLNKFTPHPPTNGYVRGVIVDITPPERRRTPYGEKEQFRVVIESEVERNPGERHLVWSRSFTPSLNEKSAFRRFLNQAFGRDVVETDLDAAGELDVDALCLGHAVEMMVTREETETGAYAGISHLRPDTGPRPLRPSGRYVRRQDRAAELDPETAPDKSAAFASARGWQDVTVHVGRHAGQALGTLNAESVLRLLRQWLPGHETNPRPAPDDRRLATALREAAATLRTSPQAAASGAYRAMPKPSATTTGYTQPSLATSATAYGDRDDSPFF